MANPQENIFSGYGVYEGVGLGAITCAPGSMEAFPGAGFCMPTVGTPTPQCAPGTSEPFPGAGFCLGTPGGTVQNMPLPQSAPAVPFTLPGPCPTGTIGIPPNCFPITGLPGFPGSTPATTDGGALPQGGGVPIPVPLPTPTIPPVTPPDAQASAAPGKAENTWIVPVAVGVGLVALVALASGGKKRATPNRRRRRRY